jgi:hypothetical protein
LIEGLFALRKAKFQVESNFLCNGKRYSNNELSEFTISSLYFYLQGHPAVRPELDLVEQEDQLTHEISLQEEINQEITLGMFYVVNLLVAF